MSLWRPCSSCKKPISHGQIHQVCSVSTCNRPRSGLVFCSVACWDSHVPVMNHRDAWCEERRAPKEGEEAPVARREPTGDERYPREPARTEPARTESARTESAPDAPRRRIVASPAPEPVVQDVLIVASRLKDYITSRDDMNMSADVLEALSDIVRAHTADAMDRARADGRKTVKGRDFR